MTRQHLDNRAADTKFNVQAEAQKQKLDLAMTKHAGKSKGNTEPNAGGENRKAGDCKARMNDRSIIGGE